MANSVAKAEYWAKFVASRPELQWGRLLLEHFNAGVIKRLCDCGCNSFDIDVSSDSGLAPLLQPSEQGGRALEMEFYTGEEERTIGVMVFVNAGGLRHHRGTE